MQQDQLIPLIDSNPYFQHHIATWRNPMRVAGAHPSEPTT